MKLSDLFEDTEPSRAELKKLAQEFHDEMDGPSGKKEWGATLSSCASEHGNCAMVSETFNDWLKSKGIKSKSITGHGATNPKWAEIPKEHDEGDSHTAVVVGSTVIDFTARQFDKQLPNPRLYDVAKFKEEWKVVE